MYKRSINLDLQPQRSFFLWGPRQVGKSHLLKACYPEALYIDLLLTEALIKYQREPHRLHQELMALKARDTLPALVVIDEIQKVPLLLNEVHWFIENLGLVFALCGSSARKVRHGHANLLGGRADRFELLGLVSQELGQDFDLITVLNQGYLPAILGLENPDRALRAYCADYLKEEIANEGLVRNLPQFANFLNVAALSDTELISYATIARDCGVSAATVKNHFEILEDTLMGAYLPAYRKRPKRRIVQAPKFYFFDVGVVNHLAQRGQLQPGSELFGKAFENWVHHELRAHRAYSELYYDMHYWRLSSGVEVDFILGDMHAAIEAKASQRIHDSHLKGLREIKKDHPDLQRRMVVCLEKTPRVTQDGIEILPYKDFAQQLWGQELMA